MKILLGTTCVCLLVILCVLLWKYISLKKNIRHFSQELEKLKDSDYRQPVKVTDFDRDLVELAVKVNEHTDIQRQLGVEYEERKKKEEEIKVGDEVVFPHRVFVITSIVKNEYIMGFDSNGERCSYHYKTKLKKTGRTFPQIIEVLEKIKEKQNEQI